jgi:cytochrome c oxidase accessory protein FixG
MELPDKNESFRDTIATVDKEGKRAWIFPKKPSGKLFNLRAYLSYVYLIIFFGLPFIKVNGEPIFLIDILHTKFILFGMIFWAQDFFIFGLGMLIFIVFIALFTVVFGRVFCGWACPQTIFMEMLFRRIEYFIEGDANHQKKLTQAPWTQDKVLKRVSKFVLFFALSYLIANTLLCYLISLDEVVKMYIQPSQNVGGLVALLIFTFVFYLVYSYLREQICIIVCPYGRMQGVLLDKNSIVVAYDYERGEPRHKIKKSEEHGKGDCIDCGLCVQVCPTGIDIRNGTQLECINCTACIDECDSVMEKVNLPIGLIRYASENDIQNKQKLTFTTRMKAYTAVLVVLLGVETFLLTTRSDYDATILRAKGMLYQQQPDDKISNLYTIKLVNKTRQDLPVEIKVENMEAEIQIIGKDLMVKSEAVSEGEFFVIGIYSNHKKIKTVKTNFLSNISRTK